MPEKCLISLKITYISYTVFMSVFLPHTFKKKITFVKNTCREFFLKNHPFILYSPTKTIRLSPLLIFKTIYYTDFLSYGTRKKSLTCANSLHSLSAYVLIFLWTWNTFMRKLNDYVTQFYQTHGYSEQYFIHVWSQTTKI